MRVRVTGARPEEVAHMAATAAVRGKWDNGTA